MNCCPRPSASGVIVLTVAQKGIKLVVNCFIQSYIVLLAPLFSAEKEKKTLKVQLKKAYLNGRLLMFSRPVGDLSSRIVPSCFKMSTIPVAHVLT